MNEGNKISEDLNWNQIENNTIISFILCRQKSNGTILVKMNLEGQLAFVNPVDYVEGIKWVVSGVGLFSLLEWLHHRFGGHTRKLGKGMFNSHQRHHYDPSDGNPGYLAKLKKRATIVIPGAITITLISKIFFPLDKTVFLVVGAVGGYMWSEFFHYQMHHRAPIGPIERFLWRVHYIHHWDDQSKNFGFSSPLWDIVFATASFKSSVTVPPTKVPQPWPDVDGIIMRQENLASL